MKKLRGWRLRFLKEAHKAAPEMDDPKLRTRDRGKKRVEKAKEWKILMKSHQWLNTDDTVIGDWCRTYMKQIIRTLKKAEFLNYQQLNKADIHGDPIAISSVWKTHIKNV